MMRAASLRASPGDGGNGGGPRRPVSRFRPRRTRESYSKCWSPAMESQRIQRPLCVAARCRALVGLRVTRYYRVASTMPATVYSSPKATKKPPRRRCHHKGYRNLPGRRPYSLLREAMIGAPNRIIPTPIAMMPRPMRSGTSFAIHITAMAATASTTAAQRHCRHLRIVLVCHL